LLRRRGLKYHTQNLALFATRLLRIFAISLPPAGPVTTSTQIGLPAGGITKGRGSFVANRARFEVSRPFGNKIIATSFKAFPQAYSPPQPSRVEVVGGPAGGRLIARVCTSLVAKKARFDVRYFNPRPLCNETIPSCFHACRQAHPPPPPVWVAVVDGPAGRLKKRSFWGPLKRAWFEAYLNSRPVLNCSSFSGRVR